MAYTYNDWMDSATYPTAAARLTRLRQHMSEVSAQMGPDVASQGNSRSAGALTTYYQSLLEAERRLKIEAGRAGSVSRARFRDA